MDFKKRWCLLVGVVVMLLFLLLTLERHSRCPDCVKDCSEKGDATVPKSGVDASYSSVSASSEGAGIGVSGIVRDCITWEVRKNLTQVKFDLRPLSLDLFESGEDANVRRETFQKIYAQRDWPADDPSYTGLKASGPGAMMRNAQGAVAALHSLITRLKSHLGKSFISILDLPCGDLQWMSRFLDTRMDVEYTGVDIVPDLIAYHRKRFRRFQNAQFAELDVVSTPLNRSFDLVFCRNMLQHLWLGDAVTALQRISASGSRFLLTTTFHDTTENADVDRKALGDRKSNYNLERAPFSLEPPICTSYDWNVEHLSLWLLPLRQKLN